MSSTTQRFPVGCCPNHSCQIQGVSRKSCHYCGSSNAYDLFVCEDIKWDFDSNQMVIVRPERNESVCEGCIDDCKFM